MGKVVRRRIFSRRIACSQQVLFPPFFPLILSHGSGETLLTKTDRLAASLGTLDEPPHGTTAQQQSSTLDVKVQAATRFLLEQIAMEWVRVFPGDPRLDRVKSPNKFHPCQLVQKIVGF